MIGYVINIIIWLFQSVLQKILFFALWSMLNDRWNNHVYQFSSFWPRNSKDYNKRNASTLVGEGTKIWKSTVCTYVIQISFSIIRSEFNSSWLTSLFSPTNHSCYKQGRFWYHEEQNCKHKSRDSTRRRFHESTA